MDPVKKSRERLEWIGVITAIGYSILVVANVGLEFTGCVLLLVSAVYVVCRPLPLVIEGFCCCSIFTSSLAALVSSLSSTVCSGAASTRFGVAQTPDERRH